MLDKGINLLGLKVWITRSSIISVAPTIELVSRFLRTVILSRVLIPDEFGVAVAISVVLGTAALATDVALDKFTVVHEGPQSLAAAHALSLVRGALLAFVLAAAAPATATLFGVPQFAGSFAVAAFVPLVGSCAHLGIKQIQRNYEYGPETVAFLFANVGALLVLILALSIFRDHRAIVAGFLAESVIYTITSHLFARSPYRLRSDQQMLRAALSFGVPLMLNGIGLAAMAGVDRALVGHWFGVALLASYAVILSLSVTPLSLALRVFGTLTMSYMLSAKKESDLIPAHNYNFIVFFFGILATLYALLVASTIDILTPLIFSHKYIVAPGVHVLITMIVFLRFQCAGAPTAWLLRPSAPGNWPLLTSREQPDFSAGGSLCSSGRALN